MSNASILAMIMAGGEGKRLYPLTAENSKPAVPFGGRYRIVDFVLSNFVNSDINSIYLLVQYKSQSLIEHVRKSWVMSSVMPRHFVTVVPPQMHGGSEWFQGTADAVYQNLDLIHKHRPDIVAVFGADHIYRMDVRQMATFHLDNNADITIAALPVALDQCPSFGVIAVDSQARITEFQEKPQHPIAIPSDPAHCYASMGNYLFKREVLIAALQADQSGRQKDFGRDVIPRLLKTHRVMAYNFAQNEIPGVKAYEEPIYWRDVGTIEAYFAAHQDVLGLQPRFDVFNPEWPIHSSNYHGPVAKIISGDIKNSAIGGGSVINGARVHNSVIRRGVVIEEDVQIEDSIVMDYSIVGRGSRLRRTIVDRHNILAPGTRIGFDYDDDKKRYFMSDTGIVVVPQGQRRPDLVYDPG